MQFFLRMRKKAKEKKGFTLIELLIVIAILAILALLGLPRLAQFTEDAKVSEVMATGEVIGRAGEAYLASHYDDFDSVAAPGNSIKADIEDYLTAETVDHLANYSVTASSEGVVVTYDQSEVTLDEAIVYDSTSSS